MDEGTPGMIPSVNVKNSVPALSALQLVKGVKKDGDTLVAHHLLNPLFSGDRGSSLDSEARVSFSVVILPGQGVPSCSTAGKWKRLFFI